MSRSAKSVFSQDQARFSSKTGHNDDLFARCMALTDARMRLIVKQLRPRLILRPKSLANSANAESLAISSANLAERNSINVPDLSGRRFGLTVVRLSCDDGMPVILVPHPSALRYIRRPDRPVISTYLTHQMVHIQGNRA